MSSAHAMAPEVQKRLRELAGNDRCVDCNAPGPQWASVSYGVFFCLECSGRHRSLGVHISYVRSVSMDAWKDREIRMMEAGGNRKLRDFFAQHGVSGSIIEKYHTPAAAMYRDMIIAARDGTAPPTDIASYVAEAEAEKAATAARLAALSGGGSSSSSSSSSSSGAGETPAQRDARQKAEAQERLRAKFGAEGLKGQSAGYGGISSSSGGGGEGGGDGDDFFAVDWSASTAKLSALAGSTLSTLSTAAKSGAARVAESSRDLSKKVQEAHISDKLSTGLEKVKATVADPELMTKVQTGASSLWAKSVVTAGSWWSSAKTLAAEVMAEPGAAAPAAVGGSREGEDASAVAMGGLPPADAGRVGASGPLGRQPPRDAAVAGSSVVAAGAPVSSRRTDDADDDAAWLAAQVASVQQRDPGLAAVATSGGARRAGAAAGGAEWEGAGWEGGLGEEEDEGMGAAMGAGSIAQPHPAVAPAAAAPAAKAAAASSSAASSAFDLSDIDAVLTGAATAPAAKPVAASPAPAATASAAAVGAAPQADGDFFSAWGVS